MLMPFVSRPAKYSASFSAGTGVPPSPPIPVVTPISSLLSARGFVCKTSPDASSISIQPGETYLPVASISRLPLPSILPILTKRPSLIATSARIHGFPAPSSTRPFRMTTSYAGSPVCAAMDTAATFKSSRVISDKVKRLRIKFFISCLQQ